jgi:hypothetical protein
MIAKFFGAAAAVLLLASCVSSPVAKTAEDVGSMIVPGKGMGNVVIGVEAAEIKKLCGEPLSVISYEEEYSAFDDYGYDTDRELQFMIGFDYVLEYDPSSNASAIPAWKLYFKNDRLVYINFSSFVYTSEELRSVGVAPACFFYGTEGGMIQSLGNGFAKRTDESGNEQYSYPAKGITPIIVDGVVRVFHVYAPRSQ